MGTRNLTMAVADGKIKLAQYCQWDGYPSGQGEKVLTTLQTADLKELERKIRALKPITPEDIKKRWVECGADPDSDMVSLAVSDRMKEKYPHLQRDLGGDVLNYILSQPAGLEVETDVRFAGDSLFCEWAYLIDFDKGTFEAYGGYNTYPLSKKDRFFFLQADAIKANKEKAETFKARGMGERTDYYPIRMIKSYKLSKLPTSKKFEKDCNAEYEASRFLDIIRDAKVVDVPSIKTSHKAVLAKVLSVSDNLPLLTGLDSDLDEQIERRLKVVPKEDTHGKKKASE